MLFIHRLVSFFKILLFLGIWKRNSFNQSLVQRSLLCIPWWLMQIIFAIFDILCFGTIIRWILLATNQQKSSGEKFVLEHINLNIKDIDYLKTVVIIENSWIAKLGIHYNNRNQLGIGIASTIHFSRKIDWNSKQDICWVMHELAHTLQWKYRGLIYIPEALICQRFSGYRYGGKSTFEKNYLLRNFNPEQQAEIFMEIQENQSNSIITIEILNGKW